MAPRVLVTGGSGFIGVHCLAQLLEQGYRTRTTVRSLRREADIRAMLDRAGVAHDALELTEADLLHDDGWDKAVDACDYVLHVASPFPEVQPRDDDELVRPAREGTVRVLEAAREAGVKRVVLTSSFAAIGYGHREDRIRDESEWTELDGPGVYAYIRSKTLAERAAWELAKEGGFELSVVNPVGVIGPVWGSDLSTSIALVKRLLDGKVPGLPKLTFGLVDVRDVADLHLRAMTAPEAKGERFLAISGEGTTLLEVAHALKQHLGDAARKVPTRQLPDALVRLGALFDASLRQVTPSLGKANRATSAKAQQLLGWQPRSVEESLADTGRSLVELGLVRS
jgi:nucleoside-diphosphate-sugar epimerase